MDILRDNATREFLGVDTAEGKARKFAQEACQNLTVVAGYSSATDDHVALKYSKTNEKELTDNIARGRRLDGTRPVGETAGQPMPSLELVFLPPPDGLSDAKFAKPKGFSMTKQCFHRLFEYLDVDYALLSYLTSSRSGWYCVRGQGGRHSFLYKDYMYTLAWTFHPQTRETRGTLAARSDFQEYSKLQKNNTLQLPTLPKDLLDQPLALAFIALTDCVAYLEQIIEKDGYTLGEIEGRTGYGLWVKAGNKTGKEAGKESAGINLTELEEALRKIAKLIGKFLTLFKSVEVSQSMTKTIEQAIKHPGRWGAPLRLGVVEEPSPWEEAVYLLKARIHSVDQSGQATIRRAKAMSNVVSGLISRLVARRAVADGSSMKVMALMTMLFLPATFVSALWSVPALDKEEALTKQNFGIYWVVTIPVTLAVFVAWYVLNNDWKRLLQRIQRLDIVWDLDKSTGRTQDLEGRAPHDLERGGFSGDRNQPDTIVNTQQLESK